MNIDISIPRCWSELNQSQLRYLYNLLALGFSGDEIKTYCFFRWSGLEMVAKYGKDYLLKYDKKEFLASPLLIQSAVEVLCYVEGIPEAPVRLDRIAKCKGCDPRFHEVPFKRFIVCDNLYQGYLITKREDLLDQMAENLYSRPGIVTSKGERLSVFYWWASLKQYLASEFSDFFASAPSSATTSNAGKAVKRAMNAQIRALTKGDITKEREVLEMDTWRALTELDALAREYSELEKKYPKK